MNFAFNSDQDLLRDTAARLLKDKVDLEQLTSQGNKPDTTYDKSLWQAMVEMGWPSLIIPEAYGGLGLSLIEWTVLTEEFGKTLAPCPYLGNYSGTLAMLAAGTDSQKQTLLPGVIDGTLQLALAWNEQESKEDPTLVDSSVTENKLTGSKQYVVDADTATHLIVTARNAKNEIQFYVVATNQTEVKIEDLPWMDVTRRVSRITFDAATAEPMSNSFANSWSWISDRIMLSLASESAGGASTILEKTVAYTKERVQFGKTIASYQAIKHKCADLLTQVESAKTLTYYAAWALSDAGLDSSDEASIAAAMAKSYTTDAYKTCTAEAIQTHGAIGFTWEMPIHLYYKRARANAISIATSNQLRDNLIQKVVAA